MNADRANQVDTCAKAIAAAHDGPPPRYGMVLGSGMGPLADSISDPVIIDYGALPGFPQPGVEGHAGRLVIGQLQGVPVAVMQGRAHYYEHGNPAAMAVPVQTMKAIGCEALILTNAAGSVDADLDPGSVMIINDHLNLTGVSPLFGNNSNDSFVYLADAYDVGLRADLELAAKAAGVDVTEGVYCWFSGPQFETPAEIKMARILGATVVGMSTVPEVILARHADLKVAAMSNITNLAAGMSDEFLSHEHTQIMAVAGAEKIRSILKAFFAEKAVS